MNSNTVAVGVTERAVARDYLKEIIDILHECNGPVEALNGPKPLPEDKPEKCSEYRGSITELLDQIAEVRHLAQGVLTELQTIRSRI